MARCSVPKDKEWKRAYPGPRQICSSSSQASPSGQHSWIEITWMSTCFKLSSSSWKNNFRSWCSLGRGKDPMFHVVTWIVTLSPPKYFCSSSNPNKGPVPGKGKWSEELLLLSWLKVLFSFTKTGLFVLRFFTALNGDLSGIDLVPSLTLPFRPMLLNSLCITLNDEWPPTPGQAFPGVLRL